jgi:hypothetical protein
MSTAQFEKLIENVAENHIDMEIDDYTFCDVILKPLSFEIFDSITIPKPSNEGNDLFAYSSCIVNKDENNEMIKSIIINDAMKSVNNTLIFNDHEEYYTKLIDAPYVHVFEFITSALFSSCKSLQDSSSSINQHHQLDFNYLDYFNAVTSDKSYITINNRDLNGAKVLTKIDALSSPNINIQLFKYYSDNDETFKSFNENVLVYPRLVDDVVRYQEPYSSLNWLNKRKDISLKVLDLEDLKCSTVNDIISPTGIFIPRTSCEMIKSDDLLHYFNSVSNISEKIEWKQLTSLDLLKEDQFISNTAVPKFKSIEIDQTLRITPQVTLKIPDDLVLSNYLQPDSFTSQYIRNENNSNQNRVIKKTDSLFFSQVKDISYIENKIAMLTTPYTIADCLYSEDNTMKHSLLPIPISRIDGKIFSIFFTCNTF